MFWGLISALLSLRNIYQTVAETQHHINSVCKISLRVTVIVGLSYYKEILTSSWIKLQNTAMAEDEIVVRKEEETLQCLSGVGPHFLSNVSACTQASKAL